MNKNISVMIAVYKDYKSLEAVLYSLTEQSMKTFEVIIAEDCQEEYMVEFLKKWKDKLNIKHVFQEDKGFRKNKILNKAISVAEGEYFIFIDGDCIVDKDFIFEYNKKMKENRLISGRRVMLSEKITKKIKEKWHFPNIFFIYMSKSRYKEEGIKLPEIFTRKNINGLIGSNFGISKKLIFEINGFDEDYEQAGIGEDDDIYMRLKKIPDIEVISIRNRAIQYHLNHKRSGEEVYKNHILFEEKMKNNSFICKNGIVKY